jgi:hypothetical protein
MVAFETLPNTVSATRDWHPDISSSLMLPASEASNGMLLNGVGTSDPAARVRSTGCELDEAARRSAVFYGCAGCFPAAIRFASNR